MLVGWGRGFVKMGFTCFEEFLFRVSMRAVLSQSPSTTLPIIERPISRYEIYKPRLTLKGVQIRFSEYAGVSWKCIPPLKSALHLTIGVNLISGTNFRHRVGQNPKNIGKTNVDDDKSSDVQVLKNCIKLISECFINGLRLHWWCSNDVLR